jgi:hypothetical protein
MPPELFIMGDAGRVVRRWPKTAGAVYNGESGWCEGGRRPPELFTMGDAGRVVRRWRAAGLMNEENCLGIELKSLII